MVHDGGHRLWCRGILDQHSPLLGDTWRWAKALNGGPGGSVVFLKSADEEQEQPRVKSRRKRETKEERIEKQAEGIPTSKEQETFLKYQQERSRKLKALAAGRSLNDRDREALMKRGVETDELDQLEELGVVSINEKDVSLAAAGAPGVDDRGNYAGPAGFLIPAYRPTADGGTEYLGMQISTCQEYKSQDKGKYIWLSMGKEAEAARGGHALSVMSEEGHLDSTPMFSHIGGDTVEVVHLCDGALKTFVTAIRQKQAAFGAPGAMFSSSMGQLRDGLRRVVGLNGKVKIGVAADAADPGNRLIMEQLASVAMSIREWGYQINWVELHQEQGKELGRDIDETDVAVEDLIEQEAFFQKMTPGIRKEVRKGLARKWESGFRPMRDDDVLEPQLSEENPILYRKGQRTQKLSEMLGQGHRVLVDTSTTGAGKSFWWSHLEKPDLDALNVKQVVVLSERYLEQAAEFEIGMVRGRQAQGVKGTREGRLFAIRHGERLSRGETQVLGSNCTRSDALAKYQARNMSNSLSALCTKCPSKDLCSSTAGGYRYERDMALNEPVVVMHPRSLQEQFVIQQKDGDDGGMPIPETGVVLDDVALEQLLETVSVDSLSVGNSLDPLEKLLSDGSGIHELIRAVSNSQRSYNSQELKDMCLHSLQSSIPRFGWDALFEQEEFEVGKDTTGRVRRCWLPYLKAWVEGNAVAYTDGQGQLVFKTFNTRLRDALNNAAWVLFLDATASPLVIEKLMGVRPETIAEERWLTPADLDIQQIQHMGLLGYRRSEQQNFQIKVALGKLKKKGLLPYASTAIVDTKAGLDISGDFGVVSMAYLSDSRGSNRAYQANCSTLVMIGSPNTNLASASSTYELLFGECVDLEARQPVTYPVLQEEGAEPMVCCSVGSQHAGFSRFYAHLRRAELLQALGRLRHNIREGEKLNVIVIGDTLMPFPVRLCELSEVIDDDNMADFTSCNERTLRTAAWELESAGRPRTADTIAQATGLHPVLVNEWLQAFTPKWMPGMKEEQERKRREAAAAAARHRPGARRLKRTRRLSQAQA